MPDSAGPERWRPCTHGDAGRRFTPSFYRNRMAASGTSERRWRGHVGMLGPPASCSPILSTGYADQSRGQQ